MFLIRARSLPTAAKKITNLYYKLFQIVIMMFEKQKRIVGLLFYPQHMAEPLYIEGRIEDYRLD
jgi:hypothetical protein